MSLTLEVRNLTVSAGDLPLVRGLSFRAEAGRALTILGESGSGKSLLAQAITGTLPPGLTVAGDLVVGDLAMPASSDRSALWGRTLALLPQEPWLALDPTMRVVDQVAEGYRPPSRDRALADLKALGLDGAQTKYPFQLSGGMAQRVAFAATLAGGAEILVVDEPTKGLDARLRDQLVEGLKAVVAGGRTLLTITHDVQVARRLGGAVVVVREGEIVETGDCAAVLDHPAHDYTRRLVAADPAAWPPRAPATGGEVVLSGRGLSKAYGEQPLFENVDVDIRAGDRIAITGDSGSGKTTLGNILLGLFKPDAGTVERRGGRSDLRFQKLYQDPPSAFAPHATLRRLLLDLVARHGLDWARVPALMARLRLPEALLDRRAGQLSGGELQRFALVRMLLLDPAVILADEPTSRLDPITQRETIDLLVEQATERGCALLLVTHDPAIARNVVGERVIGVGTPKVRSS